MVEEDTVDKELDTNIQDVEIPEEDDEEDFTLIQLPEQLNQPADEDEEEEELQDEIPKSDLDRCDELREELMSDRKSYAMRLAAIWFF